MPKRGTTASKRGTTSSKRGRGGGSTRSRVLKSKCGSSASSQKRSDKGTFVRAGDQQQLRGITHSPGVQRSTSKSPLERSRSKSPLERSRSKSPLDRSRSRSRSPATGSQPPSPLERSRSRSRSPVTGEQTQPPPAAASASEPRECRWIYIETPKVLDTRRINDRYWTCGCFASQNLTWMATNWVKENQSDSEERTAAQVDNSQPSAMARHSSEDSEGGEDGRRIRSSRSSSSSSNSSDASARAKKKEENKNKTKNKKTKKKRKEDTNCRTCCRTVYAKAHTVMYFTHPVIISLLRRLVQRDIVCTLRPMIRGRGMHIRDQVCQVCSNGTGLVTKQATFASAKNTPFVQNMVMPHWTKWGQCLLDHRNNYNRVVVVGGLPDAPAHLSSFSSLFRIVKYFEITFEL